MIPLWLALQLAPPAPPEPPPPWRVFASPTVHVGVRPAVLLSTEEVGAGVSVQLSITTIRLP